MMNSNSIFGYSPLDREYENYSVESVHDESFSELFYDLQYWLTKVYQNREHISCKVIRTGRSKIFSVRLANSDQYLLIWDVSFWDAYKKFLQAFFSFDTLMSNPSIDDKTRKSFWNNTEKFFRHNTFEFVKAYLSNYTSYTELFDNYKDPMDSGAVAIDPEAFSYIDEIISFAKEYVLLHELEHLLSKWSPDVFLRDTAAFESVVKYYRDYIVDIIEPEIIPLGAEKYKRIINNMLNKGTDQYSEVYSDYHAFFEVLLHHNENFKDKSRPFSNNLPTYIVSLKLLKFFESYRNYMNAVIFSALSNAYLGAEFVQRAVHKMAAISSMEVYSRDYLVVDLVSVALGNTAEYFGVPSNSFYASIDTTEFARPYSDVMEPIYNDEIKKIIAYIIRNSESI